ncbi:MAG TPA: hypothetical protein VFH31_09670 [Pyrinomonadaceae bacterium]|nr:hypothetical protein [Pyrinomonadaceae bacterium]
MDNRSYHISIFKKEACTVIITLKQFFRFVLSALVIILYAGAIIAFAQAGKTTTQPMPTQQSTPSPSPSPAASAPAANPADVNSIEAILAAVYDVISGPAGKKRDWDRMRSLFLPGARLIPTGPRQVGGYGSRVLGVEDYVARGNDIFEKEGFFEKEIARQVETFGNIAHAFSTYEARHSPDDAKPFVRGINSIQLMNDGKRWWIVTIFWQAEDAKNPLPEKYLK